MITEILILAILIILNAFFAASEIALISLNDHKVKVMAESGNKKAKMLMKLLGEPSRFLATIQIGITLAGFLASAFAAENFSGRLTQFLLDAGVPVSEDVLHSLSLIVITLILAYFTLVMGELVPKRVAMTKAEPIAMFVVRPLTILSIVTGPFVKLLTLSTNILVRLFGVDPKAESEQVTEEEIRMMVDVGQEKGTIQDTEKVMINNIFEFNNKTVSDVMTHRTNVVAVPTDISLSDLIYLINEEKYSRYPVYEDNIDNIVGILNAKDLMSYLIEDRSPNFVLKEMVRAPYLVPSSRIADDLFKELQKQKVHMSVVIDEYGGTAGIVTIEDLLEEIVGNIFDEHDEDEFEISQIDDMTYIMNGTLNLRDAEEYLNVDFPTEDYDTISGFLIGQIGYIPTPRERRKIIEYKGIYFTIVEADKKRIKKVKAVKDLLVNAE